LLSEILADLNIIPLLKGMVITLLKGVGYV
jgi:hypothetical protein